jgi:proline-specific peptidase
VVINGGPGVPHNYDLPLRQLACEGREVFFYDQCGTGQSTFPGNSTIEDYPFAIDISYLAEEELFAVIEAAVGRKQLFHLVGDSFGTQVLLQFALNVPASKSIRANLASLVLNGPIPSSQEYTDAQWDPETGTIGTMPAYFRDRYLALAEQGAFDDPEFEAMEAVLVTNFLVRVGIMPFPDCFMEGLGGMNTDIYVAMEGPSEYLNWTGTLAEFDVLDRLQELKTLPVLLTSGGYDYVRPQTVDKMYDLLASSEKAFFPHSGHVTLFDVTGELLETMEDFMHRVEEVNHKDEPFVPFRIDVGVEPGTPVQHVKRSSVAATICILVAFAIGYFVGKRRSRSGYATVC